MKFEPGYTPANLRAIIVAQGWTQKQAAEALGVTERTLRNWLTANGCWWTTKKSEHHRATQQTRFGGFFIACRYRSSAKCLQC